MSRIMYHPCCSISLIPAPTICAGTYPVDSGAQHPGGSLYDGQTSFGDGKQLRWPPTEAHFGHLPSCVFAVADTHSGLAPGAGLLPDWSRNAPNCPDLVKGRVNVVQAIAKRGDWVKVTPPL